MTKQRNIIVEQMPYCVTKDGEAGCSFIEARFRSVSDAILFRDAMSAKYDAITWHVIFQYYNDHGSLLMRPWGELQGVGLETSEA